MRANADRTGDIGAIEITYELESELNLDDYLIKICLPKANIMYKEQFDLLKADCILRDPSSGECDIRSSLTPPVSPVYF